MAMSQESVQGSDEVDEMYCELCKAKGRFRPAEGFCDNCVKYFCSNCLEYHSDFLPNHVLKDKSSMPQDFCLKPCAVHVDEIIKFYCPSCQQFFCSRCKEENHALCSGVSHLPALVQRLDLTAKTRVTCSSLEKSLNIIITREGIVDDNIKSVGIFATIAKTAIEKQAQAVKDWVDSNCKKLKEEVCELEVSAKEKLKSERTQLNVVKSEIESLKSDIDNKEKIGKRCELFMSLTTTEESAITDRVSRVLQNDVSKCNFKASTKLLDMLKDQSLGSIERESNCDTTTSTLGSVNSRLEPTRYIEPDSSLSCSSRSTQEFARSNEPDSSLSCRTRSRQIVTGSNEPDSSLSCRTRSRQIVTSSNEPDSSLSCRTRSRQIVASSNEPDSSLSCRTRSRQIVSSSNEPDSSLSCWTRSRQIVTNSNEPDSSLSCRTRSRQIVASSNEDEKQTNSNKF